jgi:hypothetical protein
VDYGNLLPIPDETKSLIESYRSDWKDFCDTAKQSGKPTLAEVVAKAQGLAQQFDKIFETYYKTARTPEREQNADAISDLLVKTYPTFVPAFEGSFFEQEYFRPSVEEFRKHSHLGTTEDKQFFASGITLQGDFPAWMDRTWDYGGCLKFGEFDWVDALDRIVQVRKTLQSDIYRMLADKYETSLFDDLIPEGDDLIPRGKVCVCMRKEALMEDLQNVRSYLQKNPHLSSHLPRIESGIDALQQRKVTVNSESEAHCSGG